MFQPRSPEGRLCTMTILDLSGRGGFARKSVVDALEPPTEAEVGTVGYRMVWDTQVIGFGLQHEISVVN